MSFGEKLKQARTRKGLTQRELAEIMKVSKNTITSWEIGTREPNVLSIKQLLSVLGLSADELLETSQEEKAPALQKAERELSDLDERITTYGICRPTAAGTPRRRPLHLETSHRPSSRRSCGILGYLRLRDTSTPTSRTL